MHEGLAVEALELWRGDRRLVLDLSFAAGAGTLVRIAGQNGSGKTTLLRAVCGLTHAESGNIKWRGSDIYRDLDSYHADLAWLGHRDGLRPELSAQENLAIHRRLAGRSADSVVDDLEAAGIAHLAKLPIRSLSAGQKRRVALTRIINSGTQLWLLDEPFANLDTQGQQWGIEQLQRHVAGGGICVLSTHLHFEVAGVVTVDLSR
ncbi:MAG: cytochrome c biogenesis heme-transporting ATPase CcmA [Gammaproteobacteria bacterium]|nr:cytochrome c biogenesis heme-transporting ATPase CcmA [Gammaproteobacteria bacterium]